METAASLSSHLQPKIPKLRALIPKFLASISLSSPARWSLLPSPLLTIRRRRRCLSKVRRRGSIQAWQSRRCPSFAAPSRCYPASTAGTVVGQQQRVAQNAALFASFDLSSPDSKINPFLSLV